MQLPIKVHYATLAMLALAERFECNELLQSRVIAAEQKIPTQFLGQILQQLRSAGLISSVRGANGGFMLQRSPSDISIAAIVDAIGGAGGGCSHGEEASPLGEAVQELWQDLRLKQRELLESKTLQDLLQRSAVGDPMFYI